MDINEFIPAFYSQMKQAEVRTAFGVQVMKKTLDVQRANMDFAVELLAESRNRPKTPAEATGRGYFLDTYL